MLPPKTLTAGSSSCYFFPLKAVGVTEHPQRMVQFSDRELKDLLIQYTSRKQSNTPNIPKKKGNLNKKPLLTTSMECHGDTSIS